ncbi:MAG: HD domain-containing protein [Candidatus Gastranaerophilales bacterium]|nr:HD domain-containing protein [Candidatus Gastranaerophilales bacterium]
MNYNDIQNIQDEVINKILTGLCSKNSELYIVGGYIRDLLINRPCYDRDYTVIGESAIELAKKAADCFNGYFVLLDKDFDIARVVMPDKKNTLDFAGCINQNIHDDLKRRDYTINSIAYRIDGSKSGLIDPFNGINDLENKKIRALSEENLVDDPLRVLRAYRLASQLGFEIDELTIGYIKKHKAKVNLVSVERINAELIKLFEGQHSAYNLNLMKESGLLYEIFPEMAVQENVPPNLHHHLKLIDHSIEVVRQIEANIPDMPEWFKERLNSEIAANIKIISLLKFSGLLHDLGKPSTWQIDELGRHRFIKHEEVGAELAIALLKRLKFSKNSIKYITRLIKYHLYPSQLLKNREEMSEKAIMRMFRKIEDETPEEIILAMADRLSARGPEISDNIVNENIKGLYWLLEKYKDSMEKVEIPKLLSGHDVMEILNLPKGKEVGVVIKALHEAQISGDINTRDEAIGFVKGVEFNQSL